MKPENKSENKTTDQQNKQAVDPEIAGTGKVNKEPTLRASTTDSSRVPKNRHDDMATGGNIR